VKYKVQEKKIRRRVKEKKNRAAETLLNFSLKIKTDAAPKKEKKI